MKREGFGGSGRCRLLLLVAVVALAVAGCGYTLVGSQSSRSAGGTAAVAVVPFSNETREPVVEHFMTAALREALLQRTGFVLDVRRQRRPAGAGQRDGLSQHGAVVRPERQRAGLPACRRTCAWWCSTTGRRSRCLRQDIQAQAEYLVSRAGDVRETAVAREAALGLLARQFAERCAAWLTVALLEA